MFIFHYSFENEYAELISYEPFEGKFMVIPKKDTQEIRVRIPAYWDKEQLRVCAERGEVQAKTEGNYVVIRNASKDAIYGGKPMKISGRINW